MGVARGRRRAKPAAEHARSNPRNTGATGRAATAAAPLEAVGYRN